MTHLFKNCVTMNELMDKFYEKLSWAMLSAKNAPSSMVKTVREILKNRSQY